eukprot:CAMPEP_0178375698 /NCGR_PEP_ID=MMETSP0689_2-20121128/3023_1 /TAXON_ID=160604 /ORGANISM="Amphidinium massartii, Strain CS-259" /LENGTH=56 /DNA_ID=CAMNT_0019995701 /DNA_START=1055 /DNA_END=1225 /DNA_ORIENTATION=-
MYAPFSTSSPILSFVCAFLDLVEEYYDDDRCESMPYILNNSLFDVIVVHAGGVHYA